MVKGTLNWDKIDLEVCNAVQRFLIDNKTPKHKFVNARLLVKYIQEHPHRNLQPHLLGGWYEVRARCTRCMQRMGWKKWSGHVYLAPQDEKGNLQIPESPKSTIRKGADA